MDLVKVMETFPTQAECIAYLERLRWAGPLNVRIVRVYGSEGVTIQHLGV